jgi:hypothetical protein
MGYVVDKVELGQVFCEYFGFIWRWYNKPHGGSGTKWTQSHPMIKIRKELHNLYG